MNGTHFADDAVTSSLESSIRHRHLPEDPDQISLDVSDGADDGDEAAALLRSSPVLEDQPTTTRRELWAYYLYYNGDNGVGPQSYSLAILQRCLTAAGHDPAIVPPQAGNCTTESCVISLGRASLNVSSVVLLANGLCFAIMTVLFILLGSAADYGTLGPRLLLWLTVLCWVSQYTFAFTAQPDVWPLAVLEYMAGYISYGATLVFYAAVFPRLARFMPHVRHSREQDLVSGTITQTEYDAIESMARNHISNISTAHSNIGYFLTLLLNLSILIPLSHSPSADRYALLLTTTYFLLLGLPWFFLRQPRPGPPLPKHTSHLRLSITHLLTSLRSASRLPQTFLYLLSFFLLSDGLNTTSTLISIQQNNTINFSFLTLTYLGILQAITSTISTLVFDWLHHRFSLRTKTLFQVTNLFSILIPLYGVLPLFSRSLGGYTSLRALVGYNIVFGLFQAPYYAYSQSMMAELTPSGYEGLFFGLFGTMNRASSVLGPNVLYLVTEGTGNRNWGYVFLAVMCGLAGVGIWFVDVEKGREDCRVFLEEDGRGDEVEEL